MTAESKRKYHAKHKEQQKELSKIWRENNKEYIKNYRHERYIKVEKRKIEMIRKNFVFEKMKIGCAIYGYNKCARALDFHHIDTSKKILPINANTVTHSWKIVQQELKNCILICRNCHAEIHSQEEKLCMEI